MKKVILLLVLTVLAAGGVFAQSNYSSMPKNNVSIDIAPLFAGVAMGLIYGAGDGSGFGFAVQYERQLSKKMSIGGKFTLINWSSKQETIIEVVDKYNSYSIEGHFRIYPSANVFFLDSMFGFANYSGKSKFDFLYYQTIEASRFFLKIGEKVGWRIDFGAPGGFYFEPSAGLYYALGFGPNVDEQLSDRFSEFGEADNFIDDLIESLVIVGGPRISLSVGWRF
ncbi:MAG: hypothetical protein LBU82_04790 [Treponema sp.]|jgi:hypothetical protein|nr:hypothetical protein [Treponema sp.]